MIQAARDPSPASCPVWGQLCGQTSLLRASRGSWKPLSMEAAQPQSNLTHCLLIKKRGFNSPERPPAVKQWLQRALTPCLGMFKNKGPWKFVPSHRWINSVPELFMCPGTGLTVPWPHSLALLSLEQLKLFQIYPGHNLAAQTPDNLCANTLV